VRTVPKILFIGHDAGRTGAPFVLLHLLRWLKSNTDVPFEILLRQGGALEPEFCKLAPTYRLNGWHPRFSLRGMARKVWPQGKMWARPARLKQLRDRRDWGLIYSNTITNGAILSELNGCGCPAISHVHEMEYWIERSGTQNLQQVKQCTTHYIAAADAVKKNLIQTHGMEEKQITVIHEFIPGERPKTLGIPPSEIRAKLGIPPEAFIVGGSGAEFWRKGRDLASHLLAALGTQASNREFHFIWVGAKGTKMENHELWHDLKLAGVASRYHETGEVSNPYDYFAAMDAFALLSREDPFPLVCLEAASLCKPILCFEGAGGMPEFVREDAGYVVPYLDVAALADKLKLLSQSVELQTTLGQCAADRVKECHTVDNTAPKLLGVINQFMLQANLS
jgi:glycosyltransferase involved in cell wall biosynthesis